VQHVAPQITHDTQLSIVDAPLTLIFIMRQGGYSDLVCLSRQPEIPSWLTKTYQWSDFPGWMTKNCWRSVDAHFQDGTGRVLQSVLPLKVAKNSFMTDCNLSAVLFPRTHDQQSLTLCERSFSRWGRERVIIMLPIKAANTPIRFDSDLIPVLLPYLQNHKSLTLRWRSF